MKVNIHFKILSFMFFTAAFLSSQDLMAGKSTSDKLEKERHRINHIKRKVHKEDNPSKQQKLKQQLKEHQDLRDHLKAKKRENRNNVLNNVATGVGIATGIASLL